MSKLRFACHLIQFGGEQRENPEKVLREVADAGWEGVESVPFEGAEGLVEMATFARSLGLHIVNAGGAGFDRIRFNITLGNNAAEVPALGRGRGVVRIQVMKIMKTLPEHLTMYSPSVTRIV